MTFVWAYSSLDCFEQCPRKFHHKYVLRIKEPMTPQMQRGVDVHKAIENYLLGQEVENPQLIEKFLPLIDAVARQKVNKTLFVEYKMAITQIFHTCAFFAGNVWGRGAADAILLDGPNAFCIDWKDGKKDKPWSYVLKYEKPTQLAILALFIFKHFPAVQKVTGCNAWLEHGRLGPVREFTRAMEPALWMAVMQKIQAVEEALRKNLWREMPGPLCRYCPVKICPHNRS